MDGEDILYINVAQRSKYHESTQKKYTSFFLNIVMHSLVLCKHFQQQLTKINSYIHVYTQI